MIGKVIQTNTPEQVRKTKLRIDRLIEMNRIMPLLVFEGHEFMKRKKEIDKKYSHKL